MKIISFNVNGIRAIMQKTFAEDMRAVNADIICLQETKATVDQVKEAVAPLGDYHVYANEAEKKGYSGTALLVRKGFLMKPQSTLDIPDIDQEGRLIEGLLGNTALISGYFPNASDGLKRLSYKRSFSSSVIRRIKHHQTQGRSIILVGDLNVAPEAIDLYNPEANKYSPGFTDEERQDFKNYLALGLVDIHRHLNPDTPEIYTWWSNRIGARSRNAGWRIDIFLISQSLTDRVQQSLIHPKDMGSDHCPIELQIEI